MGRRRVEEEWRGVDIVVFEVRMTECCAVLPRFAPPWIALILICCVEEAVSYGWFQHAPANRTQVHLCKILPEVELVKNLDWTIDDLVRVLWSCKLNDDGRC